MVHRNASISGFTHDAELTGALIQYFCAGA